jgi:ABC-type polysaccharide/polyol phosphate export permease
MNPASNVHRAVTDIARGLADTPMWLTLGWQDIKQRYRRSILGPLWLTISTGVMVAIMGPLYAKLFNQDIGAYFAYLTVGFVLWQLIAQVITDSCGAFIAAEGYIKQVRMPLSVHVLRVIWKNVIIFLHNLVVIAVVLAFLRVPLTPWILVFPLGVLAFALNGFLYGIVVGVLCARFRDIPIIMTSILQATFFLTPVIWQPAMLGRHAWVVNLNPFYHVMEIIRAPLLGGPPSTLSCLVVLGTTVVGVLCTVALLSRYRARVPYWV